MRGHLWTILPHLLDGLRPPRTVGAPWSTKLEDPSVGSLTLTGILDEVAGANRLVILVHGMGGNADKGYVTRSAQYARSLGMSSLRLNLRGSAGLGQDICHAGLVADLEAAVQSRELASYRHLHALGFSLGGHMVTRYALDPDPRMRSVAAVCAPIDLDAACVHIDSRRGAFYRRYLLGGLKSAASRVHDAGVRRLTDTSLESIRLIRDFDDSVTAPRFGFADANDYYRQVSVGYHLDRLAIPTHFVFASGDPIIPESSIEPALKSSSDLVSVRLVAGGHVHTPAKHGAVLESLRWLASHGTD